MLALARKCAFLMWLAAMLSASALAQDRRPVIHIGVLVVPPAVIKEHGTLTGFSVEMWQAIATRLQVETKYEMASDTASLYDCVRSRLCDLAMPQFITWERDQEFDFSYPVLTAGQRIMVLDTGESKTINPILELLHLLGSRTSLEWLGAGVLLILVPAHVAWFLDRGREGGVIPSRKYFPGIFQAMYWAATTLLTQAEQAPRQWLARTMAFIFMFVGLVFVAFYTAQLTSNLTVQRIRGEINGPEDLPGKRVATIGGTVSADYLRDHDARIQEYSHVDEMYAALLQKQVDAVLFAGPTLLYYASHGGHGKVTIVGPEINQQEVGFVFPVNSPLRRKVDSALLSLHKDGTYGRIYKRWFGDE
ncbi:transporter substrate-binding domain-containing protein [Paraburkholderia oxyphila]|uniref:transporter substrate-binding domain-containing protein n=1 Tax=Paraburkholderia oxyphila TaxID=614212 RepID=UPI00048395A4|nr:transporter substrate-binding domain-containing protein [Paraburkholderia oxyphila]